MTKTIMHEIRENTQPRQRDQRHDCFSNALKPINDENKLKKKLLLRWPSAWPPDGQTP